MNKQLNIAHSIANQLPQWDGISLSVKRCFALRKKFIGRQLKFFEWSLWLSEAEWGKHQNPNFYRKKIFLMSIRIKFTERIADINRQDNPGINYKNGGYLYLLRQ
jgi:hypothetical protein